MWRVATIAARVVTGLTAWNAGLLALLLTAVTGTTCVGWQLLTMGREAFDPKVLATLYGLAALMLALASASPTHMKMPRRPCR